MGSTSTRQLTETAVTLIQDHIQANIKTALDSIQNYRDDYLVTLEEPSTESYFIYPNAHGYRCPAIFIEDDGTDFRQREQKANFINALMSINVSVKVEDQDKQLTTYKAWRYQAALHQVLDLTRLANADNTVNIVIRVGRIKPSGLYTYANSESDSTASFFFEYMLNCEVEFFENF